ncbi:porin family protein [bacterium]|nr:porin family protein [bacterium]MBU1883347.1 porin family protein [bacterium]
MKNKVIKGLLLSSIVASGAFADVYVGAEYGYLFNTFTAHDSYWNTDTVTNNEAHDISAKLGVGTDGDWKAQIRVSRISYPADTTISEVGFDIIKEFELSQDLYPYVQVGFGYGWGDVSGYEESTMKEKSVKGGVGISYKADEHIYLIAGIDYIYSKEDKLTYLADDYTMTYSTVDIEQKSTRIYAGINFTF